MADFPSAALPPAMQHNSQQAPIAFAPNPAPIDAPVGPLEPKLAAALGLDPALPWVHPPMVGREIAASRPPRGWNGVLPAGCCHRDLCAKLGPCPHAATRCEAAPGTNTTPEPEYDGPLMKPVAIVRCMADD